MRIRTDDEVYRVDAVWLGPPKATFPWRTRYVAWGVGIVVFLLTLTVERQLGIGFSFFSTAWAVVVTIVLTRVIVSRISHERPLGAVLTMLVREVTAPRGNMSGQGGTVGAARVRVSGRRPTRESQRDRRRSERAARRERSALPGGAGRRHAPGRSKTELTTSPAALSPPPAVSTPDFAATRDAARVRTPVPGRGGPTPPSHRGPLSAPVRPRPDRGPAPVRPRDVPPPDDPEHPHGRAASPPDAHRAVYGAASAGVASPDRDVTRDRRRTTKGAARDRRETPARERGRRSASDRKGDQPRAYQPVGERRRVVPPPPVVAPAPEAPDRPRPHRRGDPPPRPHDPPRAATRHPSREDAGVSTPPRT